MTIKLARHRFPPKVMLNDEPYISRDHLMAHLNRLRIRATDDDKPEIDQFIYDLQSDILSW